MKNIYKLVWSEEALNGLEGIFTYLEREFSEKDVQKFAIKFDKHLEIIIKSPETFPFSNTLNIRRIIVAKLTSIYYKIEGPEVKILSVIDNRQNAEKFLSKP